MRPGGLASLLAGADACIANYVFRIILVSIPLVVLFASFARFIQLEREKRQGNELFAKDFLITVLFVFFAVIGVRLVYITWEFFGVPVNCMFYSLGLYEPSSPSLASACGLTSTPDITHLIPRFDDPSQLGINVCGAPSSGTSSPAGTISISGGSSGLSITGTFPWWTTSSSSSSSGGTMPFINDLAFALEIVVTLTRLSFFALPIFMSSLVILKPLVSMFEEVREKQEHYHVVLLKVLATAVLVIPAIMIVINYIYITLYIDYSAILSWVQNVFLKPGSPLL